MLKLAKIEEKILEIRGEKVIVDRDVAELYGVETKRINEAIARNPDKFPEGYVIEIDEKEYIALRSQNATLEKRGKGQHTKYLPTAITEKGLVNSNHKYILFCTIICKMMKI